MNTKIDRIVMNKLLEKAAEICIARHKGQTDKSGKAYFLHPMRVAMKCTRDEEKIVAMLHDVIEDCGVTPEYLLAEGFPQEIVDAILSVTKQENENYTEFVARAKQNPIGRIVKIHDIEDNLDITRLSSIDKKICQRCNKYLAAREYLLF